MELDSGLQSEVDIELQSILLAASRHDIPGLRKLLEGDSTAPANVQDPETGFTPLHAAIAGCEPEQKEPTEITNRDEALQNGGGANAPATGVEPEEPDSQDVEAARDTLHLLLANGAIWNELDQNGETPGCIAHRLKLEPLYSIMVDAGVRAEMLLSHLDQYERLDDDQNDEEEIQEAASSTEDHRASIQEPGYNKNQIGSDPQPLPAAADMDVNIDKYLSSSLTQLEDRLVDSESNEVMMSWEKNIMTRTAEILAPTDGLRILNVGHGMGIIDDFLAAKSPTVHHIIEAHPDVISNMKQNGWYEKPGVTIHEGKWQDVLPKLMHDGILFDAIFFDTFAEEYKDLRNFFEEQLIAILDDDGRFSFFNGLGADRQISYDVSSKIVEIDLLESGYRLDWETIPVPSLGDSGTWNGLKRPYWKLDEYKLPIVRFLNA
ncbi:Arginine N-methyltransferase 2 [Thelotrema lepadinum]|nr:Arginine N-methyltransferase 2 [Thelotrema lepadinum]